jgi:hypothetical protein
MKMMDQILEGLVPGVVSGIVTSLILFLFLKYWAKVFIPWFEDRVYRGVRIDRRWKIYTDNQTESSAEVTLKQSAHRISGVIAWNDKDGITDYLITGEFKDLILTATYQQRNTNSLDRGTITLYCLKNGAQLTGCYAWYDVKTSKIASGAYELRPC